MVLAIVLAGAGMAHAQQDSSLTRLFDGLSAKERNRIAKQEQEEAAKDAAYQSMMEQGDALFREQRYDEALEAYQDARRMRPYNVYPKVRIQDLQALIARKQAEARPPVPPRSVDIPVPGPSVVQQQAPPPEVGPEHTPPVEERPVQTATGPAPPPTTVRTTKPVPPRPVSEHAPLPVAVAPPVRSEKPDRVPQADGMEERMFKEGRSVVVERTVVEEGRVTIYRKVMHPWGGAAYFKDAIAISERAWEEVFGR